MGRTGLAQTERSVFCAATRAHLPSPLKILHSPGAESTCLHPHVCSTPRGLPCGVSAPASFTQLPLFFGCSSLTHTAPLRYPIRRLHTLDRVVPFVRLLFRMMKNLVFALALVLPAANALNAGEVCINENDTKNCKKNGGPAMYCSDCECVLLSLPDVDVLTTMFQHVARAARCPSLSSRRVQERRSHLQRTQLHS